MIYELNYDEMHLLDAEDLGEGGIAEAYEELMPEFIKLVKDPAPIEEDKDGENTVYSVTSQGRTFPIYSPDLEDDEGQNWGRAAHALFTIVNMQLEDQETKLYAVNGGNELGGFFLTLSQYEDAKTTNSEKSDWPYLVKLEHPSYGHLFP